MAVITTIIIVIKLTQTAIIHILPIPFFGRLARQMADINKFLAQLISNRLPKSEVLHEKVSLDDDGLCTMDLLIERKEDDGTLRKYKIKIEEVTDDDDDDDDSDEDSDEETTDYFTP